MNLSHPYGYPVALALLSIACFFFIAAYREVDQLREDRRQRRLDQQADAETRNQTLEAATRE